RNPAHRARLPEPNPPRPVALCRNRPERVTARRGHSVMALRWTYRWELRHLLELCGFVVEAEYSDFHGALPAYGKELIVVARRETNLRKRASGGRFRAPSAREGPS